MTCATLAALCSLRRDRVTPSPMSTQPTPPQRGPTLSPRGYIIPGDDYEARVRAYEAQGMTTSDAQGTCDAEDWNTLRPKT